MLTHCHSSQSNALGDGKHHLQSAPAQVPLQRAPLSCGDVELMSCMANTFLACFMFSIKNIGSSSHKRLSKGLFTLARIISKVEITGNDMKNFMAIAGSQISLFSNLPLWTEQRFQYNSLQTSSYTVPASLRRENEPQTYSGIKTEVYTQSMCRKTNCFLEKQRAIISQNANWKLLIQNSRTSDALDNWQKDSSTHS